MKQHPNRRRAAATATRSGMNVALLRFKSQTERDQIMSALNSGQLVLINAPNGQFLMPAEASNG